MSKVPVPGPLELKLSQPLEWYDTGARVFKTLNSSTSSEPSSGSARLQASMSNVLATTTFTVSSKRTRRGWCRSENEVLRDNGMAPIDRRRVFVLQSHEFALKTTVNEQQLEPTRQTPASHCQESCQPLSGVMPAMVKSHASHGQESCQPRSGVMPAMVFCVAP